MEFLLFQFVSIVHSSDMAESGCTFFTFFYQVYMRIDKIHNYVQFYSLCFHTIYQIQP